MEGDWARLAEIGLAPQEQFSGVGTVQERNGDRELQPPSFCYFEDDAVVEPICPLASTNLRTDGTPTSATSPRGLEACSISVSCWARQDSGEGEWESR